MDIVWDDANQQGKVVWDDEEGTNFLDKARLIATEGMAANPFSVLNMMESGAPEQQRARVLSEQAMLRPEQYEELGAQAFESAGIGRQKEEKWKDIRAGIRADINAIPDFYNEPTLGGKTAGLAATVAGGLAGAATDPTALINPARGATPLITAAKNAMVQSAINTAQDVAQQQQDIAVGLQQGGYSPAQTAGAAGIGAVLGGGLGYLTHGKGPAPESTEAPAKSIYTDLKISRPELAQKTDAEITDWLVAQDNLRTQEIMRGEQGKLELDDKFGEQMLDDWRAEAQGELATLKEQAELARQAESGTKDLFQGTGLPEREALGVRGPVQEAPVDPMAMSQAKEQPGGLSLVPKDEETLPWGGGWKSHFQRMMAEELPKIITDVAQSPVLQRTMNEVNSILDQMIELRSKAMAVYTQAAERRLGRAGAAPQFEGPGFLSLGDYETLHAEYMAKFKEADEALQLQAFQLKSLIGDGKNPAVAQWAEQFAKYIGDEVPDALRASLKGTLEMIRKQDDSLLGMDFEKAQAFESMYGIPRWPDPIVSKVQKTKTLAEMNSSLKALDSAKRDISTAKERAENGMLWDDVDSSLREKIDSGVNSMEALLQHISQTGSAAQKWFAQKLLHASQRDTHVVFNPRDLETDPAGRYLWKDNRIELRQTQNMTNVLLHEAAHSIIGGHIDLYLRAMSGVGRRFSDLPRDLQAKFAPMKALDSFMSQFAHHLLTADTPLGRNEVYGLKNLHEFVSEFYGSREFRELLRGFKPRKELTGYPAVDKAISMAKNAYELVSGLVRQIFAKPGDDFDNTGLAKMFELNEGILNSLTKEDQFHFNWEATEVLSQSRKNLKDALPEGMKHLADHIIKLPTPERAAMPDDVKGMNKAPMAGIIRDLRPFSEAVKSWEGLKDISSNALERLFVPGGKAYAWVKEHPALSWVVDTAYHAKQNVRTRAQNILHDPKTGVATAWQKLTAKEQGQLWNVIKKHMGTRDLNRDDLINAGLTNDQINAYLTSRKVMNDLFAEFNAERAVMGLPPVKPQPGYWPHRWRGNYELIIREKTADPKVKGRILHVERGNNLHALKALEEMFTKDGQFSAEPAKATQRPGELKDSFGLYNHLLQTMDRDSPERTVLKDAMKRYAQELADKRKYFKRHFEPIAGVGGYLGDRMGDISPERHAKDALSALEGYVKDGLDWMYTNRASRELTPFFSQSEELGLKNVAKYGRQYWSQLNGHEEGLRYLVNRITESVPEMMGLDRSLVRDGANRLRHELTLLMLGYFKPAFLIAQVTQSAQFVAPMVSLLENRLDKKASSNWLTMQWNGHHDAFEGVIRNDFTGKGGAFRKEGVDYLRNSGIITQSFMETAKDVFDANRGKVTRLLRGEAAMIYAEQYARTNAFFQFAHVLKDIAPDLPKKQMFDAAADLTEMAMVNYARTERANVFHQMGVVGDVASALTTFKFNLATQLYKYTKEAIVNRAPKPLMQLLAVQAILAGGLGMPGREEMDTLISVARARVPGMGDLVTPTEAWLRLAQKMDESGKYPKEGGDILRYGVLSGTSGVDISPTFSAGAFLPEPSLRTILPVAEKALNIAGAATDVLTGELGRQVGGPGSNSTDRMRLAKEALPATLQGVVEKTFQTPEGIVPNPNREMAGTVRRPTDGTSPEWLARHAGARTTKESTELRSAATQRQKDQDIKLRQEALVTKAKKLMVDSKDWSHLVKDYTDLGGDPTQFIQSVTRAGLDANTTQVERDAISATTRQRLERLQSLRRMRGE